MVYDPAPAGTSPKSHAENTIPSPHSHLLVFFKMQFPENIDS